jgi:hypothetical protein
MGFWGGGNLFCVRLMRDCELVGDLGEMGEVLYLNYLVEQSPHRSFCITL